MYIIKRIINLNYKRFFKTIKSISKKTNKNKIIVFLDIVYCGLVYKSGYVDYDLFEMYKLNHKERKTILTRGKNNNIIKKYNNKEYTRFFSNKGDFNYKFNIFLKRDWLVLNDRDSFNKFISNKDEIMVKPINGTCGKNIEKIKTNKKNLYQYLKTNNLLLLEEVINQHKIFNDINDEAVNTIRVVTINKNNKVDIVAIYFRIGNLGVVDNFNSGGMVVPVDKTTGIIKYPAIDKRGNVYDKHPRTNHQIKGYQIPYFEELKELCIKLGNIIPEVSFVGWDIALSNQGYVVVEGNDFPGHDIYQLPQQRENNIGVYPEFMKIINNK